ncbi:MAG TPA: glycosyltransferase family 4 protein [Verrucomicrobiae bacterium]|nr:glycosyltransferase family 4 protein [Verrucomicrobiae bacterium]
MTKGNSASPAGTVIQLIHDKFSRGGGMEQYALTLAKGLKEVDCRVIFHCSSADPTLAREMGIEVHEYPVPGALKKLRAMHFFRQIERAGPELRGHQIALTRVKARDAVICGGTHRGYLRNLRKWTDPFDLLHIWMETQAYRFARRIISHSHLCTRELVTLYGLPAEKIVTLHPPVATSFTASAGPDFRAGCRRELGLPADKVVFLFPSTGHKRKGLRPIFDAMRGFSERAVLAVAGSPPRGFHAPFLFHLGYVQDMAKAYAAADFAILGSYYEPFGLVGVEAVMTGTRLVFEKNIGCLEVVQPGGVVPFSVWDSNSIQGAIRAALDLAANNTHRITDPVAALTYNPQVAYHVNELFKALRLPG